MTEKEYEALVEMFNSKGWKYYIGGVEASEEAAMKGSVEGATTNDAWQWLRGWLTCTRGVLGYETFVRLSYESQQEEEYDADL